MILTCPNCYIRYLLDSQILEPSGRRVRCSACQYIWFQNTEEESSAGDDFDDLEDEATESRPFAGILADGDDIPESLKAKAADFSNDLPEDNRLIPVLTGVAAAALIFLLSATLLVLARDPVIKAWPPSAFAFNLVGFEMNTPGQGLIFDRVKANTRFDSHGNEIIDVEGKIINLRDKAVSIPKVEARLLDEQGNVMQKWFVDVASEKVGGEESLTFKTSHPETGEEIKQVQFGFIISGAP